MEPEFALRMERTSAWASTNSRLLQWSRSLHSGWNAKAEIGALAEKLLQWSRSLHSGWNLDLALPNLHMTALQWSRSLHSGWNRDYFTSARPWPQLQWSRSLHSGWNCSLKIAKENKPCKRLFRAPERRGRIFLSIQHGGRKNSFILADCHCENPPL